MRSAMWVGGGITGIGRIPILGAKKKGLSDLIQKMFSKGEQGFFYDPSDLSTMYQGLLGNIPVTSAGQPVGLMLDKVGMSRVTPLLSFSPMLMLLDGGAVRNADGSYTVSNTGYVRFMVPLAQLEQNAMYEVTIEVLSITGTGKLDWCDLGEVAISGTGTHKTRARRSYDSVIRFADVASTTGSTMTFKVHSIRMIAGNHAYQTTSAARPILQDVPKRIDFDAVDDKLTTNLPTQLTGCTVIRSVPDIGTQILTGQTIPVTYEDNTDHCGLIVINRVLAPSETSAITAEFNKRAGV